MSKKKSRPRRLGPGHHYNPWTPTFPTSDDCLVTAMTALREATAALGHAARSLHTPGICDTCGCTDGAGCDPPCHWIDPQRRRCSRCEPTPKRRG